MDRKETAKKLPEAIILDDELRKYRITWMAILGNAQKAYEELLNDKDVGESLPEFEKLNSDWLNDFVAAKIDAVMQSPNTYNVKTKMANEWHEIANVMLSKLEKIEHLRQIDTNAVIEAKGCHLVISNIEELLKEKAKFDVPEWYQDYYDTVVDTAEMITKLRDFQTNHSVKNPIQLTGILELATQPEKFIRSLIFDERQRMFEEQSQKPSKFALENQQFQAQIRQREKERLEKFEKAKTEKTKDGERVYFGTSTMTKSGNTIKIL